MNRFGKHPPKADYRTLRFKTYATKLPAPPPSLDLLDRVFSKLGTSNVSDLYPMDANDTLSDCTIAGAAHAITTYRGLVGSKKIMSTPSVVKVYRHLTGGPDAGLVMLDVLNYWRQTGIGADKILAFVKLDPKNHTHVRQAIELFGGVYLGFQVQENCVQEFDAQQPWTPGPLTQDGHAVYAVGYDKDDLTVLTWGSTQKATWAWWNECVDEAYAILPPQAKQADFTPNFDFAQLQTDLESVAS